MLINKKRYIIKNIWPLESLFMLVKMSSREDINEQIQEMQEEGSILSFYPAEINVEDNDDPNVSEVKNWIK